MKAIEHPTRDHNGDPHDTNLSRQDAHRRNLVREMVSGAILPKLLARKDAGVFDLGRQIVRLNRPQRDD
ncbi:MAG: hypothetical protein AAGB05_02140 [Pseudomonadota bacterium]